MSKTLQFLKLDLRSIKPYLGSNWNIVVFLVLMLLLVLLMRNPLLALIFVPLLAVYYAGYPFALGESVNMNGLYTTLGIERRDVVRGRYLFALIAELVVMVITSVFVLLGYALYDAADLAFTIVPPVIFVLPTIAVMAVGFWWLQVLQLPLYFKFGYNKARFLVFGVILALLFAMTLFSPALNSIIDFIANLLLLDQGIRTLLSFLVTATLTALLTVISYRISLRTYQARDF
jgi:hypothetical protein